MRQPRKDMCSARKITVATGVGHQPGLVTSHCSLMEPGVSAINATGQMARCLLAVQETDAGSVLQHVKIMSKYYMPRKNCWIGWKNKVFRIIYSQSLLQLVW